MVRDQRGGSSLLPLAAVDETGILPAGLHQCIVADVHRVFVEAAPGRARRQVIWDAFELWLDRIEAIVRPTSLWIDGSFVTYHTDYPDDIDVLSWIREEDALFLSERQQQEFHDLMTDPTIGHRVQPMSGLVDAFMAQDGSLRDLRVWRSRWERPSHVSLDKATNKGFLEVIL